MAEPESILQLGIEAAHDGNKEQARGLFRLLTMQEPDNVQAWLWLAGVAETREERQAALERVLEIDPNNKMALEHLRSVGRIPQHQQNELPVVPPAEPVPSIPPAPPEPAPSTARDRYDIDEDDPFAALDTLSEAMNEAPTAVRRTDENGTTRSAHEDRTAASSSSPSSRRTTTTTKPNVSSYVDDDDEETVPAQNNLRRYLIVGVAVLAVVFLLLFGWNLLFGNRDQNTANNGRQPTAVATPDQTSVAATQAASLAPTTVLGGGTDTTPTETAAPSPVPTDTAQPPTTLPDPAAANPAIVPANTPLESNGWLYDFNRPNYASPIIGNLGSFQPQGRFVVVLVFVANRTGQSQPISPDFFVLKDAQGRVYTPNVQASSGYVIPGVNADLNHAQPVPANGLTTSVALIFDVAPDATKLVFFARSNPSQGWLVLERV